MEREAKRILAGSGATLKKLERASASAVAAAAEITVASLETGGTVYLCGNGGSAADAQHFATELSGRYLMDRPALPAVALTTNSSALTAIGNDYGFKFVFSRQLEGLGTPGDVLVAISTSGNSANVLEAAKVAHALGMHVIGMTGAKGRRLVGASDVALVTPSDSTPRIQEGHVAMGHALCELIEKALFGATRKPSRAAAGTPRAARSPLRRAKAGGRRS